MFSATPSGLHRVAGFTVHAAFQMTGGGAIVAGHLPRDAIEEGDLLRWTRDGVVRHEACTGVAPVLVRDPAASPMIGLMVSNVEPSELPEGLVTEVLSTRVDRGAPGGHPVSE